MLPEAIEFVVVLNGRRVVTTVKSAEKIQELLYGRETLAVFLRALVDDAETTLKEGR